MFNSKNMNEFLLDRHANHTCTDEKVCRAINLSKSMVRFSALLNCVPDLNFIFSFLCEEITLSLDLSAVSVFFLDRSQDILHFVFGVGLPPDFGALVKPVKRLTLDRMISKYGYLLVIPDIGTITDLPNLHLYKKWNVKTLAWFLLHRHEQPVGLINVYSFGTQIHFGIEELLFLKGLTDQASLAIENIHLNNDLEEQTTQLTSLYDSILALNSSLDFYSKLEFLCVIARSTIHAERIEFYKFLHEQNQLHLKFGLDSYGKIQESCQLTLTSPEDEGDIFGWVVNNKIPLNKADLSPKFFSQKTYSNFRSVMLSPVVHAGDLYGILAAYSSNTGEFNARDERLLVLFANQTAVILNQAIEVKQ